MSSMIVAQMGKLPKTFPWKGELWGKIYDDTPDVIHIFCFDGEAEMESHGFFRISKVSAEFPIDWSKVDDPAGNQVAVLRKEIERIRGEAQGKITQLQGAINRLLAITLDTKGR